jgi:hypothetical protein
MFPDIGGAISNAISGLVTGAITFILQQILVPLATLFSFITSVPLQYTTENTIVIQAWTTMTIVADAFLGLFVIIGTIQIMYSDVTGGLRMPLGQFLAKAALTAILIQMSGFIGEQLLNLNNLLAGVAGDSAANFLQTLNADATNPSFNIFSIILVVVLGVIALILIFQGIGRIARFNLLFVLSGPAYLLSFHPATEAIFGTWIRMLFATAFEQFVQFLALTLAIQFVQTTGLTNTAGLLLTIGVMGLTTQVPRMVGELIGSRSSKGGGGLGGIFKAAVFLKFLV